MVSLEQLKTGFYEKAVVTVFLHLEHARFRIGNSNRSTQ